MSITRNIVSCIALLMLIVQNGCTYTASFDRSPYVNQLALEQYLHAVKKKSPDEIIFLKEPPEQSYVILGTLHAPEVEWTAHYTTDTLINAMQKKASEIGADAIMDLRIKDNPTTHTVGSVDIHAGYGSMAAVPYRGLHAWGEAIIFLSEDKKKIIESQQ